MKTIWLIFCVAVLGLSAYPNATQGSAVYALNHFWTTGTMWSISSIVVIALSAIGVIRDSYRREITFSKRLSYRFLVIFGSFLTTYIPWDFMYYSNDLVVKIVCTVLGPVIVLGALVALGMDSDEYKVLERSPFAKSSVKQYSTKPTHKIPNPAPPMSQGYTVPRTKPNPPKKSAPSKPAIPYAEKIDRTNTKNHVNTKAAEIAKAREVKPVVETPKTKPVPNSESPVVKPTAPKPASLKVQQEPATPKPVIPKSQPSQEKKLAPPVQPIILPPVSELPPPEAPKPKHPKIGDDELIPRSSQTVKPIGDRDNERVNFCSKCGTKGVPFASFCKKCGASL